MLEKKSQTLPWLPALDKRLQRRYEQLVKEHLQISQTVAAGLNALPGTAGSFASTQAAWRFYQNTATTLPALVQPLLEQARQAIRQTCREYALVMHDWSHLNYHRHTRKTDCAVAGKSGQRGYELQTALLVSDRAGEPLAPLCQNLITARLVHSTRTEEASARQAPLDELTGRMKYLDQLSLGKPLVHIVDREGDSVGHFRQWQEQWFLVRAKGANGCSGRDRPTSLPRWPKHCSDPWLIAARSSFTENPPGSLWRRRWWF